MPRKRPNSLTTLDLDVGNSRSKWRLRGPDGEARGFISQADTLVPSQWPNARPGRLRVSSVASLDRSRELAKFLESHFECTPEFVRTSVAAAGVICGYEDPTRLGVDRWMVMLAARALSDGPFVVIDLGTAATIDFVRDDGTHEGGFIVPGLRLMTDALFRRTADVHVAFEAVIDHVGPGANTPDAVRRGVVSMLADFANGSIERFTATCERAPHVYLCGGDANVIAPLIHSPVEVRADLVLDGLALALP